MLKINQRYWAVCWISFASGLPLLLIGSTLQAWFTTSGMSLLAIGGLSLIGFPYLVKFLWSPLVDRVHWGRLGRRKGWLIVTQFIVGLFLLAMAAFSPGQSSSTLIFFAVLVAVFASTQDIAVDAYRTDILNPSERGVASALTNVAYRVAMMVAGFVALLMAAKIGWAFTYVFMGCLMCALSVGSAVLAAPELPADVPRTLKLAVTQPLLNFKHRFARTDLLMIVLFVIFYKFADALALSLNTTFLLRKIGFSLLQLGAVAKIASLVGVLLGSFVAGAFLTRMSLYKALWRFGWLQTLSIVGFISLLFVGKSLMWMGVVLFVDYFFGGMGSVAFVVFLMGLCDKRYTATQYAILSALSALTRVLIGPVAAVGIKAMGWLDFYILCLLLGLPVMLLLFLMRARFQGYFSESRKCVK